MFCSLGWLGKYISLPDDLERLTVKEDMVNTLIGVSKVPAYGQVNRVQSIKVEIKSAMSSSKLKYGALMD